MSYNFNYETRFTAQWVGQPAVNQATNSVNGYNTAVNGVGVASRDASQGTKALNESLNGTITATDAASNSAKNASANFMAIRGALFGVQMSMFYVSMLASSMSSMETATYSVENAQERLNKVMSEGKTGTMEYRQAVRQLETAQANLQRAQTMSTIMTASMGLQVVSMGASFAQAIPQITKMISTLQTYNTVATISKALSGPAGWAMLGVGVAAGAGGVYAINQLTNNQAPKASVSVTMDSSTSIIEDYMKRRTSTNIKSTGI